MATIFLMSGALVAMIFLIHTFMKAPREGREDWTIYPDWPDTEPHMFFSRRNLLPFASYAVGDQLRVWMPDNFHMHGKKASIKQRTGIFWKVSVEPFDPLDTWLLLDEELVTEAVYQVAWRREGNCEWRL